MEFEEVNKGRWTKQEKKLFEEGFAKYGKDWKQLGRLIPSRTVIQIRTHAQKYFQKLAKISGTPVMSTSHNLKRRADENSTSEATTNEGSRRKSKRLMSLLAAKETPEDESVISESLEQEVDSEVDEIFKELEEYNNEHEESRSGRVTPRMFAAATILMAPLRQVSPKRLDWATQQLMS